MDDNNFNLLLKELKNICVQIDERFDKVDEKFKQIDKRFEQIDERFEQIDERFEQIDEKFEQIDKRFKQIDKRFDTLEKKVDSLSVELGSLNRTFFKYEVNSQKNFDILFDANKTHSDKELLFEKQLYRLTDYLDNTTFRVSLLENSSVNS